MTEARPDPYGVLRHVAAMDPPGRRTISTAEARAVLDELAQHEKDLLTIEGQRADLAERLFDLQAEMEALRAVAGGDALATLEKVKRERDSLARRCAVRFEESEKLRVQLGREQQALDELRDEVAALRAVGLEREATPWSYGDVHDCPVTALAHVADTECVSYALKHGDRTYRDAAPAGAEGAVQQIRAAAENALAHTGGEQDGYVLVQAEYVDSLRRCVAESWGHSDAE